MPRLDKKSSEDYLDDVLFAQYSDTIFDDVRVSDSFDMGGIVSATFFLYLSTTFTSSSNAIALKDIFLETDNDPAFSSPTLLTSNNFIGDLSDFEISSLGGTPLFIRSIGVLGTKRYTRISITTDYSENLNAAPVQYTVGVDVQRKIAPDELN